METIHIIPDHILHALGWTVVHSLWQGFLIALILGIFLYRNPSSDARKRYLAGLISLGGILLASVITFFTVLDHPESGLAFFAEGGEPMLFEFGENAPLTFAESLNENMPLIVLTWLVGMAFFLLKMMGGLLYVQRLKHRHLSAVPAKWEAILEKLKTQIGTSAPVRLSASALVKVPMVVGWLKPVVLMPIGAVNQLTTEQVEAILAHELAHIARYDYVLNLVQSFMEVVFYFNPAVWWISSSIRTERENCCDDLAVELCGNPLDYARALISLQEMHQASPAFALSFASGKSQLLNRIRRILKQPHKNSNAMEKFSIIGLLAAGLIMLSMKAQSNFDFPPDEPIAEVEIWEEMTDENREPIDTLPQGKINMQWSDDDGSGKLKIEDGEIIYMEIDGEEVPESEYAEHEDMVMELLESRPEPPAPPAPPRFAEPMHPAAPPAPPAPPRFREPVRPVAPPAPPSPPSPFSPKVTTERDGKSTFIIIEDGMGEPIEIEVESGKRGSVTINGEVIEGRDLKDEDAVLKEIERGNGIHLPLRFDDEFASHVAPNRWHSLFEGKDGENVFIFPEMEHHEIEAALAEAMEKHERLFEEADIFRLENSEGSLLFELSEPDGNLFFFDNEAWKGLSGEDMEALRKEQAEVQEQMERIQKEHMERFKQMQMEQREKARELRRQYRRSDGAM